MFKKSQILKRITELRQRAYTVLSPVQIIKSEI